MPFKFNLCRYTVGWEQQYDNYFRNELIEAVRIIDQGHVEVGQLRGSWAGALGQCQFMPSNFHAYAVDKDGDGRADIWGSLPDVFASMGNFISTYCEWQGHGSTPLTQPTTDWL